MYLHHRLSLTFLFRISKTAPTKDEQLKKENAVIFLNLHNKFHLNSTDGALKIRFSKRL